MSTVDRSSKFAESTSEVTSLENEPSAVQPDRTQDSSPPARNRPFGGRWGKTVEERSALAHVRRAASAERYALYRQNAETLRAWALQQPGVAGHAAKLILVDQLCTAYVAQLCVQYRVKFGEKRIE